MKIEKNKHKNEKIIVTERYPNTMENVMCSCYGKPHKQKVINCYIGLDFISITVRSAVETPIFILSAFLCEECEEKRQQWCESKTGIKRGSVVEVFNGTKYEKENIESYHNEKTAINTANYCVYIGKPGERINGKARVKTIQGQLF